MSTGKRTIEDEFGVDCRDCRYARKHGAAEFKASVDARRHAYKYAGHRVRVTQTVTVCSWEVNPDQAVLPIEAPF